MSGTRARSGPRTLLAMAGALGLLAALALPAVGASVIPDFVDETANLECDDFQGEGQTWITLKVDPNPEGDGPFDYTDGTLSVTITNADEKSFDWTSNIGVDAVYVKAGAGGSNLYRYDPPSEVTSDSDLVPPADGGNAISHISFCYDQPDATPSPTASPTPTEEETASPTPSPTPSESQLEEEETPTPTPTPRDDTQGGNPTPTPGGGTVPDTAIGGMTQLPATVLSLVMLAALAAIAYARLAHQR